MTSDQPRTGGRMGRKDRGATQAGVPNSGPALSVSNLGVEFFVGGSWVAAAKHVAERTKAGALIAVAGGGDTVAAVGHAGVAADLTFVSTAGGAFLEWMEGKPLPGVEALRA